MIDCTNHSARYKEDALAHFNNAFANSLASSLLENSAVAPFYRMGSVHDIVPASLIHLVEYG